MQRQGGASATNLFMLRKEETEQVQHVTTLTKLIYLRNFKY